MREKLSRRLEHLEKVHAAAVRAKEAAAAPRINVCEMLGRHDDACVRDDSPRTARGSEEASGRRGLTREAGC